MNRINLDKIKEDREFIDRFEPEGDFTLLGQGEYNINYIFKSKTYEEDLILRIAVESQMKLKNQISYEYKALKILEETGRTPKALYMNDSKELIPFGYLVMEYLPGEHLDYSKDLEIAAKALADIHNLNLSEDNHLIKPSNPIEAIYEECLTMFSKYQNWEKANPKTRKKIENLLEKGKNIKTEDIGYRTLINTELNSGNFLINRNSKSYIVDWEKPLYGYPAQDLGHFLTPTTTFWKTDHILSRSQIDSFLKAYCEASDYYKDPDKLWLSVKNYISMNCLRGITWCSMAYVEYQDPDKLITNEFTYEKIKAYLSDDFLDMIGDEYLNDY